MTSIDVDPEAVRACAELSPGADCLVLTPDNRTLPSPDSSVSLLVCIEVQAVADADWFLPEAARVLVPGGRLVVVVWNRWSLRGLATDVASRLRHGVPHRFYQSSYRSWRRRLRDAGLDVSAETGLCWFPFARGSDSALVPVAVRAERRLGLQRLPALSPWVLVTAERPAQDTVMPSAQERAA